MVGFNEATKFTFEIILDFFFQYFVCISSNDLSAFTYQDYSLLIIQ